MWTKTRLIKQIESFPENFSLEELFERLILLEKIELSNLQSEQGQIISDIEFDQEIDKWFI
ncbi:MAG: hypothetical protein ABI295_01525 [Xanthomarina sp.]